MRNHTEVVVKELPACDICGKPAHYDARSFEGPWGYFCSLCFQRHTSGRLGLGFGQKLVVK